MWNTLGLAVKTAVILTAEVAAVAVVVTGVCIACEKVALRVDAYSAQRHINRNGGV